VTEYFQDGSCKLVYYDNSNATVSEIVDFNGCHMQRELNVMFQWTVLYPQVIIKKVEAI